jgi:hypothetical protein
VSQPEFCRFLSRLIIKHNARICYPGIFYIKGISFLGTVIRFLTFRIDQLIPCIYINQTDGIISQYKVKRFITRNLRLKKGYFFGKN